MISSEERNITSLRREQLLDDYWAIAKRRKGALVNTALRTRSTSMRDILVRAACKLSLDSEALKQLVLSDEFNVTDVSNFAALADLGRLVLLQDLLNDDQLYGAKLLGMVFESAPQTQYSEQHVMVLIQYLISSSRAEDAERYLNKFPEIDLREYEYLKAELMNPFSLGNEETAEEWLHYFNRAFVEEGIAPISLTDNKARPFDRISCPDVINNPLPTELSRLVSVVMTSYKPDRVSLLTSVKSILEQTWKNLELIIVDDCSGPDFTEVLNSVELLDPRVRIIRSSENRGTYESRNIGYAAARGEFIAGQDDDDWSHPERITEQVKYLDQNPQAIGCRVKAIRCDENLGRVRVGYSPISENASSLLIRREGYEAAGEYLKARKGADTEYYYRISQLTGRPVGTINAPLSIIRILSDSLSRGDFSAGWKHTSRRSFRSSYEYWHKTSSPEELQLDSYSDPQVKIPRRFLGYADRCQQSELDIVFAGNWEKFGGPQKSMLEEIHASIAVGYRVGIMNLEAARFMNNRFQAPLHPEIQKLINAGYVDELHFDDEVSVKLLILRYPPILQFFHDDITNLLIDKMIILANQAPSELNGQDIRYLVEDCHITAKRAFKVEPIWVPQGPQVRKFLEHYLNEPVLAGFDMPGILDLDEWWHDRLWFRSETPVIGRHSRDDPMKWPETADVLLKAYPVDGRHDVRIMGGAKTPSRTLRLTDSPTAWVVYKTDELEVKQFLTSLDYFVFFQHSEAVEAFGRAILEAIASGTLTILPRHFEEVFGASAVYCDPEQVQEVIRHFHSDFNLYRSQIEHARNIVAERFSYDAYQRRIRSLLEAEV